VKNVIGALQNRHPGCCDDVPASSHDDGVSRCFVLRIYGQLVAIITFDVAVDVTHLLPRTRHWPEATAVCQRHNAHVTISLIGPHTDSLKDIQIVTAVAGAVAVSHSEAVLAGIWDTTVLNSAQTWVRLAADAFKAYPGLPIDLWVSMHPFADKNSRIVGVVTQGLIRFVNRELELVGAEQTLRLVLEQTHSLATYLIQNGPVLEDGSTFGFSETDRVRVKLCVSNRFPRLHVISMSM
jgi:hypothetical protein